MNRLNRSMQRPTRHSLSRPHAPRLMPTAIEQHATEMMKRDVMLARNSLAHVALLLFSTRAMTQQITRYLTNVNMK